MRIQYGLRIVLCAKLFGNSRISRRKILLEEVQGVRKEEEDLRPPNLKRLLKTIINVYGIYLFWSYFYKTDCAWFRDRDPYEKRIITKIKSPPVL